MIRRNYDQPSGGHAGPGSGSGRPEHDNGAVGRDPDASGGSPMANDAVNPSTLLDALESERKRNASLSSKLKKVKAQNRQLMSTQAGDVEPRMSNFQSTMREDSLSASMNSLSFATLNITECKPMEGEDEIDKRSFERWRSLLEAAMQLVGVADEETKMSIFRIKAGSKLLEILENTGSSSSARGFEAAPYSSAMNRLKDFFNSRDYTLLHRQKLRSMVQSVGESDVDYVKRVINIAKLCDYEENQLLENVADVIQSHALNFNVREVARKLLRKGGNVPTLLDKVRAIEIGKLNEELFAKTHAIQHSQVATVSTGYSTEPNRKQSSTSRSEYDHQYQSTKGGFHRFTNQQFKPNRGGFHQESSTQPKQKSCWRCLGRYHPAYSCPAIDKACRSCFRKGHLARAFNQPREPQKRKATNLNDDDKFEGPTAKKIAMLSKQESSEDLNATEAVVNEVRKVPTSSDHGACIEGQIAGLPVSFLIDSGAEVNTLNGDIFREIMNNDQSRALIFDVKPGSDRVLKGYATNASIDVLATFVTELMISDDRPRLLEKFYAVDQARSLLSRSTALRYSILQLGLGVPIANSADTSPTNPFPGEIFSISGAKEFPKFNITPITLEYDKNKPPSRNIYTNIPPAFRQETKRRLGELLSAGIIEPVTSDMEKSFCSSLLVVPKGKDDIRLVVDLRGPNKSIIRTPFKMPTLEDILAELHGATYFSTLDLSSAFFHVMLDEKSRHLTNFFAGDATYRFRRLPFGLSNAPDIFQEICQTVILSGCRGVVNYLDDFLIFGNNKEEHDENLEKVLCRLREHNVCLNTDKCVFGATSVKFVGFTMSKDGLMVEEDKLKAIKNFRRPETQSEVKSFLGLINFVERFIVKRADITAKLRELAKADRFYWTEEEESEFRFLRDDALTSLLKLGYFSSDHETEIFVDASPIGIGAVLVQYDKESNPRIISCASKALTESERKYPHTQKEALAIVWGVERFSFYLTGKSFTVRTDSEANEFIFGQGRKTSKRAVSRAEAWALRLQPFDFSVKRIPGSLNVADALSRLISKTQCDAPFDETDEKHVLYALDAGTMDILWSDIESASEIDSELSSVREAIGSNDWPNSLRRYELHRSDLRSAGSTIFKGDKIILPEKLRTRALEAAHQGHLGIAAMKRIIREYFWWPDITTAVEKFVKSCQTCLIISRKNPPIPLSSRSLPDGPWEILQIDFLTVRGCGTGEFLVVVDTYSRFMFVVEIKSINARTTIAALSKVFETWGLPMILQSDNGPPFFSLEFTDHWEQRGVKVRKSIPLNAQSNGAVERQNQGILKALAGSKEDGTNWRRALEKYVHVHNTIKPHSRLGVTPFELLVGWKYRGSFPALWDSKSDKELDRHDVQEQDALAKLISKSYADKHRGAKPSDIKTGDKVVVAVPRQNKIDPTFSKERYTVLSREGAKVVISSNRGVQYARNVQDVKRAPELADECAEDESRNEHGTNTDSDRVTDEGEHVRRSDADNKQVTPSRPKRNIKQPERFKDMFVYYIFE